MRITDHSFDEKPTRPGFCIFWYTQHARGPGYCGQPRESHIGESPQQDGPVRSTVERLQEENAKLIEERENALDMGERYQQRIQELEVKVVALEAENSQLHFNLWMSKLDEGRLKIRLAFAEVSDACRDEELEAVMYSRDLLRDRLNHLDTLAREVGERVMRLMGTLDT